MPLNTGTSRSTFTAGVARPRGTIGGGGGPGVQALVQPERRGSGLLSIDYFGEALLLAEPAGNPLFTGHLKANLAGALIIDGRLDEARTQLEAAAVLPDYTGDPRYSPVLWLNLGELHFLESDLAEAKTCYLRGLEAELWRQARDITGELAHPLADDITELLGSLPGTCHSSAPEATATPQSLARRRFRLARLP
jgi:hypothetical protein